MEMQSDYLDVSATLDTNFTELSNSIEIKKARIEKMKCEAEQLRQELLEMDHQVAEANGVVETMKGVVELSRKRDVAEEEELSKLRAELAALQAQTSTAWSVAQHLEARDRIYQEFESKLMKLCEEHTKMCDYYRDTDFRPLIADAKVKCEGLEHELELVKEMSAKVNQKIEEEQAKQDADVQQDWALLRGEAILKGLMKSRLHQLSELALDVDANCQIASHSLRQLVCNAPHNSV